jgi:hypothetical protein
MESSAEHGEAGDHLTFLRSLRFLLSKTISDFFTEAIRANEEKLGRSGFSFATLACFCSKRFHLLSK